MSQHVDELNPEGVTEYLGGACQPYEPSIASSASSSQLSVFSDAPSTQSSVASSVSDDFRLGQDDLRDGSSLRAYQQQQSQAKARAERTQYECMLGVQAGTAPSYAEVTSVPQAQRQHPRRNSLARHNRPPPLVRQSERKVNFVDNLVDSATQMVEVIWPLSVVPCNGDGVNSKAVLPLRTYIEETLRRSRTSYSTLQVALYYLILIKPYVPCRNFTMEMSLDCPASRALMCGRRMFLAALILASKYLQDRNYSAKAWSKMSGLNVQEINTNEKTFLSKVNWKLHIPEPLFKRWTDVVLRFTPNVPGVPRPSQGVSALSSWKEIVAILTPELDTVPLADSRYTQKEVTPPSYTPLAPRASPVPGTVTPRCADSLSTEATPTPATVLPDFLEPTPDIAPRAPALARMGPLPTPTMTPTIASSTPAASACSSRRSSMCSAMAFAQRLGMGRCAIDQIPSHFGPAYFALSRRSPLDSSSVGTSPESMITDRSRSSSICSVSTTATASSSAPSRACLARQATCRNAGLPVPNKEPKETSALQRAVATEDSEMTSSPEMINFRANVKAVQLPHRHSKNASSLGHNTAACTEKSRKRCRPRGGRRSDLQEEVRMLLEEELDTMMTLDEDEITSSPSPASDFQGPPPPHYLPGMLLKQTQPGSVLSGQGDIRVPVQRHDGNKRRCCSSAATRAVTVSPLYGEVI